MSGEVSAVDKLVSVLRELFGGVSDIELYNKTVDILGDYCCPKDMPISKVKWVPLDKVQSNDYNPNAVASPELKLLRVSILEDGYTQPIVTYYDSEVDRYIIVDGFHRYFSCVSSDEIKVKTKGMVPIVVIECDLKHRMASTVRHNRARGKHSVAGMANLVFSMLREGYSDEDICNKLGMEPEELVKLKYVTGYAKLFSSVKPGKAWEAATQIKHYMRAKDEGIDGYHSFRERRCKK